MHSAISYTPLLVVLVSAIVIIPIMLSDRKPNLREFWTLFAASAKFLLVASMLPWILEGNTYELTLFQVLPGLAIQFKVDAFGMLFALVASSLWIVTSVYSIGYMRGCHSDYSDNVK